LLRPDAGLPGRVVGGRIAPGRCCDARLLAAALIASAWVYVRMFALAVVGVADCGVWRRAEFCVGVPADGIPPAAAAAMAVFSGAGSGCVPGSILIGGAGC
jgi:hypothetical protein